MEPFLLEEGGSIITLNTQGEVLNIDNNFTTIFGFSVEETVGKKLQDLVLAPPYNYAFLGSLGSNLNSHTKGLYFLAECCHKNGTIFPVTISASETERSSRIPIAILQITRLKIPSCSITFDVSGSIIAAINPEVLEYSISEIVHARLNSIFPYLTPQQMEGELKASYKYLIEDFKEEKAKIVRGITKSGTTVTMRMELTTVSVGDYIVFRTSLEKQDFEHMEAIFCLDMDGIILECNGFISPLFGYSKNEVVGAKITKLSPEISLLKEENPYKKQKTSLDQWSTIPSFYSAQMKHRNGEMISIAWRAFEIDSEKILLRLRRIFLPPLTPSPIKICKPKQVGQYIIENTIGTGSFGKVKRAVHIITHQEVAVKILNKAEMDPYDLERSKREGFILQQLNHPHIVKFLGSEENEKSLYFFLELVGGTDLKEHMLQNMPSMREIKEIFRQIASAIYFCHTLNIIHRDLKLNNILVNSEGQIKLIDFGLSNFTEQGKMRSTFCGSPAFAAPEMLLGTKYSGPEVDIWSLGVCLYSIAFSKLPFESVKELLSGQYAMPSDVDLDLADLIHSMLQSSPEQRATIKDVVNHRWLSTIEL